MIFENGDICFCKWNIHIYIYIYIYTHCPPKVRKRPRKVGFWTILTWIFFNWWSFCTDKGQHKLRKHILLHSLYIEKLTYPIHQIIHHRQLLQLCIFWASELSVYSNVDLIYYSKPPEGLPKDDSDWLDTSYGHHGPVASSSIGLRSGDWGGHSMTDMMPADCFLSKEDLCLEVWYRPKPHFARGVSKLLEGISIQLQWFVSLEHWPNLSRQV